MTYAPAPLIAARRYLLDRLDAHPGVPHDPDLDPDEVGIIAAGSGHGYHRGRYSINTSTDYSVTESSRDRAGLTDAASALDIGEFDRTVGGRRLTLRSLSLWLVEQCRAGTPDTRDIREVIYTADGRTVRRWDRLGVRASGDNSHLTHTHVSYFRDSESRDKADLFRRYVEGDGVSWTEEIVNKVWPEPPGTGSAMEAGQRLVQTQGAVIAVRAEVAELAAAVAAMSAPAITDEHLDVLAEKVAGRLAALRFIAAE